MQIQMLICFLVLFCVVSRAKVTKSGGVHVTFFCFLEYVFVVNPYMVGKCKEYRRVSVEK